MTVQAVLFLAAAAALYGFGGPGEQQAALFFGCSGDYVFEAAPDAARCTTSGRVEVEAMQPCPRVDGIRLTTRTDHAGHKDMCTGRSPRTGDIAVEPACPAGHSPRIAAGLDRCERTIHADVRAPWVPVER